MRRVSKRRLLLIIAIAVIACLILYCVWCRIFGSGCGGGDGGGGRGGGGDRVIYPPVVVAGGTDVIVLEDHVETSGDRYVIRAAVVGAYTSLVGYGGSSVSGNITAGAAAIDYMGYKIILLGFASTNRAVSYESDDVLVSLDESGGYVLYKKAGLAVYYMHIEATANGVVHIWIPARSMPSYRAPAKAHVVVDPERGVYIINDAEYVFDILTPPEKRSGVLIAWAVFADRSGIYTFRINP